MVGLDEIREARERIAGVVTRTPLIRCPKAPPGVGAYFKPESLQPIGSFKIRGAYNRIAALPEAVRRRGVIAYSSGNHAQGVAYAARHLGIPAVIVMPIDAPAVKVAATRGYGAEVVLYDPASERREEVAARLMEGHDWTLVPPFDDDYVLAGQGTIGLEILEDLPEVDLVLVPVGGGGLIGGVATAIKSLCPDVRVIGVEPALAADAQASFRGGEIVEITAAQAGQTIADGVRTLRVGAITFAHIRRYVDDIVTIGEAEIESATRKLLLGAKLVVEPTAALPFAAYLYHQRELPASRNTVMVLSGGNIDPAMLRSLLA